MKQEEIYLKTSEYIAKFKNGEKNIVNQYYLIK